MKIKNVFMAMLLLIASVFLAMRSLEEKKAAAPALTKKLAAAEGDAAEKAEALRTTNDELDALKTSSSKKEAAQAADIASKDEQTAQLREQAEALTEELEKVKAALEAQQAAGGGLSEDLGRARQELADAKAAAAEKEAALVGELEASKAKEGELTKELEVAADAAKAKEGVMAKELEEARADAAAKEKAAAAELDAAKADAAAKEEAAAAVHQQQEAKTKGHSSTENVVADLLNASGSDELLGVVYEVTSLGVRHVVAPMASHCAAGDYLPGTVDLVRSIMANSLRQPRALHVYEALMQDVAFNVASDEIFIFYVLLDRGEMWYEQSVLKRRDAFRAFSEMHPNVFFVTWNPPLVDPDTGFIGANVIPVPDWTDFYLHSDDPLKPPYESRANGVTWRGGAEGRFGGGGVAPGFTATDRYDVVSRFQGVPDADVKFGFSRWQEPVHRANVTARGDVPDALWSDDAPAYRKVQLDIDGYSSAWELRRMLQSGIPVVKVDSRRFVQWFYPELENGEHLLVVDADSVVEAAAALALDKGRCEAMAKAARARMHDRIYGVRGSAGSKIQLDVLTRRILRNFRSYTTPRDWRIRRSSQAAAASSLPPAPPPLPEYVHPKPPGVVTDLMEALGADVLLGVVYEVRRERMRRIDARIGPGGAGENLEYKLRLLPALELIDALKNVVAPSLKEDETFYFYHLLDDGDKWYEARVRSRGKQLSSFSAKHPNMFFVHWNPPLVDRGTGFIGENMIPIPDWFGFRTDLPVPRPCAERKRGVVWRGATSGRRIEAAAPADDVTHWYNGTDRYRAVAAFRGVPNADVKFNAVKFNPKGGIPPDMLDETGRRFGPEDFAAYQVRLSVDGFANTWGLRDALLGGTPVLVAHSRHFVQWFYPKLENGTNVLVAHLSGLVAAAQRMTDDTAACDAVGAAGRALGMEIAQNRPGEIHRIMRDFRSYAEPRDWRINGTADL